MSETVKMTLAGYYHFKSKDQTKEYFVIQALNNDHDVSKNTNRGTLIQIFVDVDIYKLISSMELGSTIDVCLTPDLSQGKIYYSIIL